ncbi:hypothetical protein ACFQJ7_06880 [Halovenus rubra]|uniref:Uncharacterized protein n=2 Tax=Halovenus rubra TaxID=869890 RepID=A0ACC7E3I7_9EURY|nr:hypothetical protein [Halovenus rubra]
MGSADDVTVFDGYVTDIELVVAGIWTDALDVDDGGVLEICLLKPRPEAVSLVRILDHPQVVVLVAEAGYEPGCLIRYRPQRLGRRGSELEDIILDVVTAGVGVGAIFAVVFVVVVSSVLGVAIIGGITNAEGVIEQFSYQRAG